MKQSTWGFRGEEGHSQDDKNRHSVSSSLPCPIIGDKKFLKVLTFTMSRAPNLDSLKADAKSIF